MASFSVSRASGTVLCALSFALLAPALGSAQAAPVQPAKKPTAPVAAPPTPPVAPAPVSAPVAGPAANASPGAVPPSTMVPAAGLVPAPQAVEPASPDTDAMDLPTDVPPTAATPAPLEPPKKEETPWYEKLKIRGYTQFRYNRIYSSNDKFMNSQGDRYIANGNGLGIRRARVILFGDVHERVSVYLQTDFASVIGSDFHVPQVRDWYADLFFDKAKTFRLRLGQSKIPFGFENLQSSQNRLPLDRSDALNSAVKDERDMAAILYWAPDIIRKRFKHLVDANLKGSGDYGVVGLGVFNGQTANRAALKDNMHTVLRVTWPFLIGSQILEVGGGGYYGKFRVARSDKGFIDRNDARGFATVVLYPQPFGFVMEGNYGTGPELNQSRSTAERTVIDERKVYGGYAQVMFKIDEPLHTVSLIPYARATYYRGGKKFYTDSPGYLVKELELGVEWQLIKALEVVLAYDVADRTVDVVPYNRETGHVLRAQVQVNY